MRRAVDAVDRLYKLSGAQGIHERLPQRALLARHAVGPEPHLQRLRGHLRGVGHQRPRRRALGPARLRLTTRNPPGARTMITSLAYLGINSPEDGRVAGDGHPLLGRHGHRPRPRRLGPAQVRRRAVAHPDPPGRAGRDGLPRLGRRLRGGPRQRRRRSSPTSASPASAATTTLAAERGGQPDPRLHRPVGLPPRGDLGPAPPCAGSFLPEPADLGLRHRPAGPGSRAAAHAGHRGRARVLHQARASGCPTRSSCPAGSTRGSTTATRGTTRSRSASARPGWPGSTT